MASKRHEKIRKMLVSAAKKLKTDGELPKLQNMRPALEIGTLFSLLPWGVRFKKVQLETTKCVRKLDAEILIPLHPDNTDQVLLYFHGGGYTLGSSNTHRAFIGRIAKQTNKVCIIVEYRKSPEHQFPAALEDVLFSYTAMLERGKLPKNIILGGDSAGGGLILSAMAEMKKLNMPLPGSSVCLSPWADLTNQASSIAKNEDFDPLVDIRKMQLWASMYSGENSVTDPRISPLYADFKNFPPLLIQVSDAEMLHDDALKLHEKAKNEGVDVTLQVFEGLMHWWHLFQKTIPEAKQATSMISEFINNHFNNRRINQEG